MTIHIDFPPALLSPGCTCGPYWSVVPPPPCPLHSGVLQGSRSPNMSPKDLAELYRRLADAIDPPAPTNHINVRST